MGEGEYIRCGMGVHGVEGGVSDQIWKEGWAMVKVCGGGVGPRRRRSRQQQGSVDAHEP